MNDVPWQLVVIFGWTCALVLGAVLALRGRRTWATVTMILGAGTAVLALPVMIIAQVMWARSFSGSFPDPADDRLLLLMTISGGGFLAALVAFAIGFVGFAARYRSAEVRAEAAEGMVKVLQERMEDGR